MLSFSFTRNTGYTFPSLISIFLVFLFLLFSEVKAGNNYYISSTSGDDSRTSIQARNPATPWKTISKLNSVFNSLAAGDSILFKRGEIYTGTITPTLSGTLVSPIIISSFGIGTKPIINGFETISGWISEGSGIYSKVITVQSTPNMVTVNGINTSLGRYPKTGYLTIDSHVTNTTITDSDLNSAITNWTGAEVVIRKWNWVIDRSLITNHSGSTITYTSGSTNNAQNGYGYFIQNDLRCLTELGDWAYKSGKLYMYFGVNNPDSFVVKVSTLNKAIDISSKSNITLLNLEIQGNNIAGVYVSASSHIIVDNCDINYSGTNAITAIGSSTYLTVSNSKITNSNNKAISLAYGCTYSTIKNNTITKTGLFAGMGNNATISGSSSTMFSAITLSDAHNGLVENNNITNTGYIGICFYANNVTVNKNYIDTFCIVADDGGGIYTGVGTYIGRKISNNIVINGIGAPAGATGTTGDANGIYLDYNASNVEVYNNTVAFCSAAGIYIHNGHENNVHDNLIYGTANQLQLIQNSVDDQIRNNVIQHNSFIINSLSQTLIKESSAVNDILSFGKFSGNYYINIFKDERVSYMTYITAAKSYKKSYSYYRWLSEIDTTGKKSPLTLPLYKINSLIGTNKFTNGTFNTGVTNFSKSYSGTSTISWDNTNKINAGSAKYSISSLSTDFNESLLSGNIGPVNAGTVYEAKFSLVSTKKNRILRVKLIENLAPYRVASIEQFVTFSDTITNQKIQITPTLSLSSAKLYFFVDDDDSELYVDNIEFYEANATIVNPEDFLRFEYNATNSNSFITLAEPYLGIDNKVYSGSLSLLPYTSIILFRTTDTIINKKPFIQNQNIQLNENTPNGTTIGTVLASDPDAAQSLSYSILSGNTNGAFAINSSTGVLSVANSAALNFESTPSFALVVKVQDNGTGTLSSQATVTATLLDVNEAPVISNQSFSVTENSANGSTAGTVVASDPDAAQTKTFSILSGNTNGAFAINASTGVLSVTNSAALNFESAPSFALVVKVQDNGTGTLSSQATVTISLIDANEAPVINNQSFSVAENSVNGSTAGTVVATDPDAAQTKTFSILSGNTNGAFAINASTGVLSVANSAALNFESTPSFSLIVKVQDNGTGTLSSQATVTTTLLDVNEAPVISNQSFSVAENSANGTTAGTVVASDPDAAQTKTFSILSGNTNGAFAINASTGVLSVTNSAALNFESAPSFALVVKVQDNGTGTLSSQATVTISLIDANEAPVINNQSFSVAENSVNGSTAGTVVATDPDAAQTKTFSILSGNTNGAFAINSSTGVLSVANSAALNFESTPSFSLIVKVQDNGTGTLSSQATVTTTLLDVNEAPVISNQSFSVAENSANGTTAGTVVASDPDAAQNKTFSILSGNTNGAFAINASTGVLSVTNSAALNFESAPSFALVVKVQDNGTGTLSSQATVTVTLLDVNEAPIISNQSFSVAENSANGSTAGTVVASDPDAAQTKTFSILSGNTNGAFVINSSTGVLSVANSAALNFESTPSFALVVKVQDNGTGTLSSQATVTATILDVNEAPIISNQSFSVAENSANGSTAGTVVASDPDAAQTKTFSILSGNTNGAFVINSSTGVLSVANSAALNFESAPSFALVVKVQDNGTGTLSSQATVTVSLLDINETPVISNQSFSVAENSANGSTAGTVVASDPDVAQTKTFSILSGNTNGAFTINASTGVLSVANSAALNFESAPSFALVIKVQDNGTGTLSSQATVTVSLLDINETPVISNQSFSVAENSANGTTAGTVIASDPDAAQTKTFSILSGNTNGAFAINASTGVLSIANSAAINFESAPSFALVVKVQDNGTGALSSQATVSISLTDVNEAPVISNQSFSVAENSANGTNIGTVVASDPDAAQTKTFSILSGNTNDAFTINSSTGVLSVANSAALNFESAPSFALVVKVQDNGTGALSSQATVSISLTDVNEAPVISNQSFSVAENSANGINIGTAIASDPDAAQTKTFSILSGNTNGAFAINASTGVLSVANSPALNFESAPSFALVIKVQDNGTGTLSNQATVSISLTDVNEAPVISNQTFSVMEFASNSTSVGTVYATDPDANQSLSYFITSGNTGNAFSINILTGELIVANNTALDFSINPTFLLTIKITDNGTGNLSDLATITIAISQEPNQAPVISNQSFSVAENSANGTNIGTVVASDPDAAQTKTFSILSGNTNGAFAINASTGVLAVANSAALNFESAPSFSLIVKVQDNGTGTLSNQATVTISLTDINEAPVISNQSFSVTENSANGSTAGTVVASDPDAAQTKTFSILSGNTNGAFIINASTGVLSVANSAALNFESAPSFSLVVKVQDNGTGTLSNQAAVTISLTDVNEAPVISNQSFSVAENSANGSTAGTVVASDPDAAQTKTFSILSGNTNGAFAINASTGVLSVTNSAALNFESVPSFSLVIKVQDNGTGALSNQATVTISLTDVNEAPVISNQTFSVMEFASNSTSVGIVNATDQDADQSLSYFITSGNTGNAFSIDILTGELIVANNTALDFSINPTFLLSIKVTDNGTGNLSDLSTITITISQGSNQAPVISNQSFSVPENSANGTTIGTVVASDPDAAQTKTFSILSGNTDSAFAINASTGVLSVANSAALNFESAPSFALVVKVQDNGTGTLSNQATVTITLTDVNEEPVISNQSFSVVENSTNGANIGTVIAADPDVAQTLSYFIIYGNINHIFSINPSTGELILVDSAAINQSINSSIVLGVAVFDNGSGYLFNIATISINVLPASNKPPVINDQVFPLLKNSAIGTSVGIIKADDPNQDQTLNFDIYSGNSDGIFTINATTGELFIADTTALVLLSNDSVQLVIKVQDNGSVPMSSQAKITVFFSSNDAPVILSQTINTLEHQPIGTKVGTILATDPNSNNPLTYSIIAGNIGNSFTIDANTGCLNINNPVVVCFEGHPVFNLSVKVQDNVGLSSEAIVTINVEDINEQPVCPDQTFSLSENDPAQTFVGSVIAKDFDFNQTLTYSIISGNLNDAFKIDPGNGSIYVNNPAPINFEENNTFNLEVSIQDNGIGLLKTFANITIEVLDVNEPPVLENQILSVVENSAPGTKIGYVKANDPDKGQKIKYKIVAGDESHTFNLSDTTGLISVADPSRLFYGHNALISLTVIAQDNGIDSLSTLSVVSIDIVKDSTKIVTTGIDKISTSETFSENDISIYPNPTTDIVNIDLGKVINQPVGIRIFSINGSEVYSAIRTGEKNVAINMGNEKPGTYIASLDLNGQIYTKNIIVKN